MTMHAIYDLVNVIETHQFATTGWTVFIADINKHQAQHLLDHHNSHNRRLRKSHSKWLVDAMRRGEFLLTPEPLMFDANGQAISAQHRLYAVVQTGITQRFFIVCGIDRSVYRVIDQAARRSMADAFEQDKRVQEPINYLAKVRFGGNPTPGMVGAVIATLVPEAKDLINACGSSKRVLSSAPIKAAAVLRMAISGDPDRICAQYATLVAQDYDQMNPIMKAFSRQVANSTTGAHKQTDLFIRAYRMFDPRRTHHTKIQVIEHTDMEEIRAHLKALIPDKEGT